MYKKIIFLMLLLISGCAKAPLERFQLSYPESQPEECKGIKLRGELTSAEFVRLFECLNNNGALTELEPLLISTPEKAALSARIYNEFLGKRLATSSEFVTSLKNKRMSWEEFREKTFPLRRALEDDAIDNLSDILSSLNDEQFLDLASELVNKTPFTELISQTFSGLPHDQKKAFLQGVAHIMGQEQMAPFLDKLKRYIAYLNNKKDYNPDQQWEVIHTLAKKNIFAELQAIINELSTEERNFADQVASYHLNPKYRSLTIFKEQLHEGYIRNELDEEKQRELDEKLKELFKTFPQTDAAALTQLLIALDRPLRSKDGREDILSSLASLMKSFYTVVLLKLDIPKNISPDDPPLDHPFGPDHEVSKLFSKIVTLIYAARETLALIENESLEMPTPFGLGMTQSRVDEKILLHKLFGELPEYSADEDRDRLIKLKEAIEKTTDQGEKERLQNELAGLMNQTWNLYAHIINESGGSILGKLLKDYTRAWMDNKQLLLLFKQEAKRLAPPGGDKPELIKSLETIVTFRKTIPLIRSLKGVLHSWIIFIYQKQEWLNGAEPINILARINSSPSILREVLKAAGEIDPLLFRDKLEEAVTEFLIPKVLTPLIPFEEYLRRGDSIPDESYLTELATFIKRYEDEYPVADLFVLDALLKSYQSTHQFFFGAQSYLPWRELNTRIRVKYMAAFTAPVLQLPAKLAIIDEVPSFLEILHSKNPPFVSGEEDFELINYWGEEIKYLPSIFIKLSMIPFFGETLDNFIESTLSDGRSILKAILDLLSRLAAHQENDQLANSLFNDLFPLMEILFNDAIFIDSVAQSKGGSLAGGLLIMLLSSESGSKTIPQLLQDREATKKALLFLKSGLEREDGVYRALNLFTKLLSSNY